MHSFPTIKVGCRASPLSKAQFEEVKEALPHLPLLPKFIETKGDRDKKTSLKSLEKTNFFTREIDKAQKEGLCRLALHSAKDLPEPLPEGLVLAALTKGVDPGDVLVLREGEALFPGARIGTSSKRREACIRNLEHQVSTVDIRGNIQERLSMLTRGKIDGLVMAKAALLRLKLTCHHLPLPGPTAPLQGQLALLTREKDWEMRDALLPIDCRKSLHLGLDPDPLSFPYPVIQIERLMHLKEAPGTHLILTSKVAARLLLEDLNPLTLSDKVIIAIGRATASSLTTLGLPPHYISQEETSEGVCALLGSLNLEKAQVFWPHSQGSRPVIPAFLKSHQIPFREAHLYRTLSFRPFTPPPLSRFETLIFTSPSTVTGFLELYGELPHNKELQAQGPVTRRALERYGQATLALGKIF